ncbi:MAG TPA: NACHT domain-containing protein [Trebonia sp.]|nr:NACHT domain-containing protein [Trebonia sp.]
MLDSLRYVDVQDLATGGDHIPELGDVYVDVALVSRAQDQVSGDPLGPAAEDGVERHSIDELLDRRSPAVLALAGQPGSGKSTLLAHAARRSAQPALRGRGGRRRVPVPLTLREHAASVVANPAVSLPEVARAAVGSAAGREPAGWWERLLRRGRCVVLLDGLDEVARSDDRLAVEGWVERQIAAYPGNHFVVTSRSYGLPGPLTTRADVLVVLPFTAEQVRLFLGRWYLAAERHATGASGRAARRAARMRAAEAADRLLSLLREHPALGDLAVNPLLLTMIATAHRYRGALPGSRADLYGEMCQVLLSRRVQAKDLPELLPWSAKQTLLAALAYVMMRDHVSELNGDQVIKTLRPHLERFPASVTGEAFLDDISRNGLLVETAEGKYAFTHLTFQEYLAARHVSATPDLVKSLADHVSDPWWHETVLLYAAAADASPIVRACLDNGTIPALTLAFDCDDASAEIDPELRRRLDRERRRAYEPDCLAEHRRLIAGVQAARLVRQTLSTAAGTRICARPVPADLYWLFLADTRAPQPDSPCAPDEGLPATGVWGTEARAFVKWLNSITAIPTGIEVRLPRHDELQEEAIASTLAGQLPASVTSVWTRPLGTAPGPAAAPGLWVRPGQAHPHELGGDAVRRAVAADARGTRILPQILTAAVLDVALKIIRDLDDVHALSGALADDLTARANSEGQIVDLMHAHAHAIVLTYSHALDLVRADAITRTCAADPDLVRDLGLASARALADAIAGDLASAISLARAGAVKLARAVDQDLNVLSAFDFDLAQAVELHRAHAADLDSAYARLHGVHQACGPDLADVFGSDSVPAFDPALPLPGVLGLPLRWGAEGPLVGPLLQVLAEHPSPGDPYLAFAGALSARAGVDDTTRLTAALGSPLADVLRDLTKAAPSAGDGSPDWNLVTGLSRLTDVCGPVDAAHRPPSPPEAAALRAVALALAGGATARGSSAPGTLRTVAATVTLVESRSKGESAVGESIILALV